MIGWYPYQNLWSRNIDLNGTVILVTLINLVLDPCGKRIEVAN